MKEAKQVIKESYDIGSDVVKQTAKDVKTAITDTVGLLAGKKKVKDNGKD